MKKASKQIIILVAIGIAIVFVRYLGKDFIRFETVTRNKEALIGLVQDHYLLSVIDHRKTLIPSRNCICKDSLFIYPNIESVFTSIQKKWRF